MAAWLGGIIVRLSLLTLRIFLAAVEEGNIGKAAQREHIAASAVSKRIRDLEAELQVKLLRRHVKGVEPTAAGTALAGHVRNLFGILGRMRGELSEHAEGEHGQVRVHANGSAIVEYLAEQVRDFRAAHPMVRIDLQEELSAEVVRSVHDGVADLGIYAGNVEAPPGLQIFPYRTDRLMVILPASHPLAGRATVAFEELLDLDHIAVAESSSLAALLAEIAGTLNRPINVICTVTRNEVARSMVQAGLGVAILPEGFVRPYEGALRIRGVPLVDAWARRQLNICVRDAAGLTVAARRFLDRLRRPPD